MPYTQQLRIAGAVLCAGFLVFIPVYFALPLFGLAQVTSKETTPAASEPAASLSDSLCGNGKIESSEQCDDGNIVIEDGCTGCMVNQGYSCIGAPSLCTAVQGQGCGDGRIGFGESCDDGNVREFDGCSRYCSVEDKFRCEGSPSVCKIATAKCGDGVVDIGEPCDDGNAASGDGCSAACIVEEGFLCGSQPSECIKKPGTEPVPAAQSSAPPEAPAVPAASSSAAASSAVPVPQPAEPAAVSSAPAAQSKSASEPFRYSPRMRDALEEQRQKEAETYVESRPLPERSGCGDGIILDEACDDGDEKSGDGCSDACAIEAGYTCHGYPSICEIRCGDGVVGGSETCDDGGTVSGDGCTDTCKKES